MGIMITLFMVVVSSPLSVSAHSPGSIELDFDYDAQVLTVIFRHSVSNPNSHYVNQIEIWKNDVSYTTRTYDSQTNSTTQMDTFDVDAEDGDVLRVTGTCNQGGSRTGQITVAAPATITTSTSESTTTTISDDTTTTTPPPSDVLTIWILISVIGIAVLAIAVLCIRRR
jgi:hypothetical protein